MAVEIFLELDDVEGESLKSGFEGKIDILQFSWSSTQSATRHSGTGGGSGQANVGDIHFSKYLDKSTRFSTNTCCTGSTSTKAC